MPRIALVDDHPIVRRGFKQLIETVPDHVVVLEHGDGASLLADASLPQCDLLVLDLSLPDLDGFEVLKRLAERPQTPAVLVLSMHEELPYVREALRLGARGYLAKTGADEELLQAIEAIAADEEYVGTSFRTRLAEIAPDQDAAFPELTSRERQILRAVVAGEPIRSIAARLGMSRKTVYVHRTSLLGKLGVNSDVELVRIARARGMIPTDP
jgi:DNA-binding NarL/FixJ family response regulator